MMDQWLWRGELFSSPHLIDALIRSGYAAPAARDMPATEVVRQVIDHLQLPAKWAPKLQHPVPELHAYDDDAYEDRRNYHYPREWTF